MKLILTRKQKTRSGIFGKLCSVNDQIICYTLERAYLYKDPVLMRDEYRPKLPIGTYECDRGLHKLSSMKDPFETFEVMNIPGHTGILFHVGNFNEDSQGCILVGTSANDKRLFNSRYAFTLFMTLLQFEKSFFLDVK